uniref:30S ribosomal protein S20 n=1 Tax=Ascoseira mirabilis TaxID=76830 RepID=UPI0030030D60|nr:30S ribosomal protein S20 [Ascoseira mirabilis]
MANSRSSQKRIKINKRNRIQNSSYKSSIKSSEKQLLNGIKFFDSYVCLDRSDLFNEKFYLSCLDIFLFAAISKIDRASKKKIICKNTAARKKSSLYKNYTLL